MLMTIGRPTLADLTFDTATLQRLKAQLRTQFLTVAREAVRDAGRVVEKDLERAYEGAGAGKLAKAWNSQVFPRRGLSESPTVDIRGKGKERTRGALLAFARGAKIKAAEGMIAIPLRAAGRRRFGRREAFVGPRDWEQRTGLKLEVAKIGGKLYLVTSGVASRTTGRILLGSTRKRIEGGKATKRLLVFLLVDQVDLAERVNVDPIFARGHRVLDQVFTQKINAFIASAGQAGGAAG